MCYNATTCHFLQSKYTERSNRTAITRSDFDPSLRYASLQLLVNLTNHAASLDFECVVRGFDNEDNFNSTVYRYRKHFWIEVMMSFVLLLLFWWW